MKRLVGVDAARYLALVGMISTHVLTDGEAWLSSFANGRASALFAFLAGVGIVLAVAPERTTGRSTARSWAARTAGLAVRGLLIALLGLALGELDTGLAVILTYYGVLFLLATPFVGLGARTLLLLAGLWVVVTPVLSHLLRPTLPLFRSDNPSFDQLGDPLSLLTELTITGYYPAVPWLAYLLAGMGLARLDLRSTRVLALTTVAGLGLATGATALSRALLARPELMDPLLRASGAATTTELLDWADAVTLGTTPTGQGWQWLLVATPHTATPFDLAQTIGSALAITGACLLVLHLAPSAASRWTAVALGGGAMTLTLYCLHAVMRTPQVWPTEDPGTFWWHIAVVTVLGAVFAALGRRGPLEQIVSTVSHAASRRPPGP
ncbi:heparan-alpha-glucosaminide N-acetyltransferase domain-containing protein [Aeromicrobium sp. CF4.19]|uniref:heparan-alpha-glucosaminide N-acetyltransferase domain-containing protein n=1 Tax=Aeromicrobium sp. CF4.19 TaxID=3373082 RepID=UPI003EE793ED